MGYSSTSGLGKSSRPLGQNRRAATPCFTGEPGSAPVSFISRAVRRRRVFSGSRQKSLIAQYSGGLNLHDLPANWPFAWIVSRVYVIYIVRSYAVELKNGFTLDAVIVR